MKNIFNYDTPKTVHRTPYSSFEDASAPEFVDSQLYALLASSEFVDGSGKTITCNISDHAGPVFLNLKGDYEYLLNWYHNPHRKSNTRHGSYIMLYLTEDGYVWKLNEAFFNKLLTIPDNITDLFSFG